VGALFYSVVKQWGWEVLGLLYEDTADAVGKSVCHFTLESIYSYKEFKLKPHHQKYSPNAGNFTQLLLGFQDKARSTLQSHTLYHHTPYSHISHSTSPQPHSSTLHHISTRERPPKKVVTQEEVHQFVSSLSCCAYMDVSAKLNYNVDKLFYELFVLANLPMEMSPALHKRVCPMQTGQTTATSCPVGIPGSSSRYRGLSIRRRLSDAYGMVAPNVRRPSIRTDLLILRAKTSLHLAGLDTLTGKKPRKEVSCVIQ
ncbi:uncharacterized protein LOC126989996, partial [Eriocheir sinensis]|uniref:uncharacterized protein LOC126989996 n=1 Tax=Eriocheir sinensis TaxID=95602 RepID=UPI0021C6EAA4